MAAIAHDRTLPVVPPMDSSQRAANPGVLVHTSDPPSTRRDEEHSFPSAISVHEHPLLPRPGLYTYGVTRAKHDWAKPDSAFPQDTEHSGVETIDVQPWVQSTAGNRQSWLDRQLDQDQAVRYNYLQSGDRILRVAIFMAGDLGVDCHYQPPILMYTLPPSRIARTGGWQCVSASRDGGRVVDEFTDRYAFVGRESLVVGSQTLRVAHIRDEITVKHVPSRGVPQNRSSVIERWVSRLSALPLAYKRVEPYPGETPATSTTIITTARLRSLTPRT